MKKHTPTRPPERAITQIPLESICTGPFQMRRTFSESSIRALAESIQQYGLLSPLLVRRIDAGKYELIAGERRLRALNLIHRSHAEAIVLPAFDRRCAMLSLIENLQRSDLHFLDEAEAYRDILAEHDITQQQLAASLSISSSVLNDRLRLLRLNNDVRDAIRSCTLSEPHARALLRISDPKQQLDLIRECAAQRLNVQQLETRIEQIRHALPHRPCASPVIRDNRIIINALMDTVNELTRIGVQLESHIEEHSDSVEVVVRIPTIRTE